MKYYLSVIFIMTQGIINIKKNIDEYAKKYLPNSKAVLDSKQKEYGYKVNGIKEGYWIVWNNFNLIKELIFYKDGKRNGKCNLYYNSIHNEIRAVVEYKDDKKHGYSVYYDMSGDINHQELYIEDMIVNQKN